MKALWRRDLHVYTLVEWSSLVDVMGRPTTTWVGREFLPLRPCFTAFQGLPITREFRAFFREGEVLCVHPYWPPEAIQRPDAVDWFQRLWENNALDDVTLETLWGRTGQVAAGFEGGWSLDWAQDERGVWWAIDMAPLELSYHHGARRGEEPWTCVGYTWPRRAASRGDAENAEPEEPEFFGAGRPSGHPFSLRALRGSA